MGHSPNGPAISSAEALTTGGRPRKSLANASLGECELVAFSASRLSSGLPKGTPKASGDCPRVALSISEGSSALSTYAGPSDCDDKRRLSEQVMLRLSLNL